MQAMRTLGPKISHAGHEDPGPQDLGLVMLAMRTLGPKMSHAGHEDPGPQAARKSIHGLAHVGSTQGCARGAASRCQ